MSKKLLATHQTAEHSLAVIDWPFTRPATKAEVAENVPCTPRFVELEVNRGNLRAVRVGERGIRFLPSDVVKWLNSRPISK
jgi:hypothetical protein